MIFVIADSKTFDERKLYSLKIIISEQEFKKAEHDRGPGSTDALTLYVCRYVSGKKKKVW
jgi:hypothetical protein